MPYHLREGLSHCHVDGRFVFLDLEADSYFMLPDRLNAPFLAFLENRAGPGADTDALVAMAILLQTQGDAPISPRIPIALPARSAIESCATGREANFATALEVAALVCSTQAQLKTRRIARILASLASYRHRMTAGCDASTMSHSTERLLDATALFRHSRAFVPIEPCCLLDSIAMVRFLARRRLPATITFGVALDPFAAHCWVQVTDWVLNDTVGNAAAHTPIRSV